MSFLVGRVSATGGAFFNKHFKQAVWGLNKKLMKISPALSLSKPSLATPPLSCTLQSEFLPENFRYPRMSTLEMEADSGLRFTSLESPLPSFWRLGLDGDLGGKVTSGGDAEQFASAFQTLCNRRKRSRRGLEASVSASRVDGACDDAFSSVEESATIEDCKVYDRAVRKASVAVRSWIFRWSIISATTAIFLCRLHWIGGLCTRGQECLQPRVEHMKLCSEPVRYWIYVSCLLFCWLSVAFFLHWQVQRWEFSTMVLADPHEVIGGAFDPGGSFCHASWPNTGLGCQLYLQQ